MTQGDRVVLKNRACVYVDELKDAGWPPERVIVAVKHLANDAGFRTSSGVLYNGQLESSGDSMLVDLVGWCIHRYYEMHPGNGQPTE
jgi:hypothetical protein